MSVPRFFDRKIFFSHAGIGVILIAATLVAAFIFADPAHAQDLTQNLDTVSSGAGIGTASLGQIIARILRIFFSILGIVALGICIFGGYKWMTAGGDSKQVDEAKTILRNGVIGLVIIFSAFGIAEFVMARLFGNNSLGGNGGDYGTEDGSNPSYLNGYYGASALGQVVEWHEPRRGATNVSRNSLIQIKFKFGINPATIIDAKSKDARLKDGAVISGPLRTDSVRIYATASGKSSALKSEEVWVTAVEDGTNTSFVFDPVPYLGSASDNVSYTVELTSDIERAQGGSAFTGFGAGYNWQFVVGTQLDLTPPRITSIVPRAGDTFDRNITIQLTFSEPLNLASAVGLYDPSKGKTFDNISVRTASGSIVPGVWSVGAGFNIVEFTPLLECATNSCGQKVFCLPPNERLEVRSKSGVLLKNAAGQIESPQIDPKFGYTGVTDGANNALDGGGENATKPWSTTGGNPQGTPVDDFWMKFTTTAATKTTSPQVVALTPDIYANAKSDPAVMPDTPVNATFDSIMKVSTFSDVELRAKLPKAQAGYWKTAEQTTVKIDGADQSVTRMVIDHVAFAKNSPYAVIIPSSVQDIYQNCFLPSAGLQCKPDPNSGTYSCCNGNSSTEACTKLLEYGKK